MTNLAKQTVPRGRRTVRTVLFWAVGVILVLLVAAFVAGEIVIHRAGPILKARVIDTLSTRFDSRVELDGFNVSLVRGLEVSGAGLRLYPRRLDGTDPMFAVKKFSFFATWKQLFETPMFIDRVFVGGLQINLPPKGERANMPHLSSKGGGHIKIFIGQMICDDTVLVLGTNKPGKIPLEFDISKLQLASVGAGQPMKFHALLVNPKPVGDIDSSGYFGPFDAESPGDTPVSGEYSFSNADLGTLKGISGTLSSQGNYRGTLDNIVVDGKTSTPDFQLDIASHPVPLNTTFHAIVDGTNGDTYLEPVDAWLLHTHIVAKGEVVRGAGGKGHDITLDVSLGPANIQDILELGAKSSTPLMTGQMRMHTSFNLPSADESVIARLKLAGHFAILNAHFTNDAFQSKVDQLSLRGQGKAKQAKQESEAMKHGDTDAGTEADVASTMRGDFVFGDGKIALKSLEYDVPGADIDLSGAYTLKGAQFGFQGSAHLNAKVSKMVTGWKSLMLKPVDPFMSKHNQTDLPIFITGTRTDPHIGVDFHHKDHDEPPGNPAAAAPKM
jgi:hypothetical protein